MMSIYQEARATLFRAMVGERPIPTAEAIAQAKLVLRNDAECHVALDELVSIILVKQRTMGQTEWEQEEWHARLQAYIAAQLSGQAYVGEFADVRRALDASVTLSEEYALLYTTMEHEWQGTLPVPLEIPVFNSAALDLPLRNAPMPATPALHPRFAEAMPTVRAVAPFRLLEQRWRNQRKLAWQRVSARFGLQKFGTVVQPVMVFVLTIALVAGLWATSHQFGANSIATPTYIAETVKHQDSFFKTQMQLETPFPRVGDNKLVSPTDDDYNNCRFLRPLSFVRSVCKL